MLKFIGRYFEFLLGGIALIGVAFLFWWHQVPTKHKCCAGISVICDCEPNLCRCGNGKTCTDSCYAEAKRKGEVR